MVSLKLFLVGAVIIGHCVDAAEEEQDNEAGAAPEAQQDEAVDDAEASPLRSAEELMEKLGKLKTLLAEKGDKVSPGALEKIKDLEKSLNGLGLSDKLAGGANPEVTEFFGACTLLAMGRAGAQRAS